VLGPVAEADEDEERGLGEPAEVRIRTFHAALPTLDDIS
jgi:hypothetical protein